MEIIPGLHRLLGRTHHGVNAYLWRSPGDDLAVLFDCGWPWNGAALAAELRELECAPEDLRVIALTHDDVDHAGRLAQLLAVSKATAYAHALELPRFERSTWRSVPGNQGRTNWVGVAAWAIYSRYPHHPVRHVQPLEEGDELPGGWVTMHTPGHTPGHASYYHPIHRVLIAGDSLGPAPIGRLRSPQPAYCEDNARAHESIVKLAALDIDLICCGHGPIIRNGRKALRQLIAASSYG